MHGVHKLHHRRYKDHSGHLTWIKIRQALAKVETIQINIVQHPLLHYIRPSFICRVDIAPGIHESSKGSRRAVSAQAASSTVRVVRVRNTRIE